MKNVLQPDLFSQEPDILKQFYNYLPPRPHCTEFLGQLKIRPKAQAIKDAYIQPNSITRAYWMVFDIDSPQSRYWPEEWHVPTPNIEARNPKNNHQHLFYMIAPAVYTLRQAKRKPLELAADVDKGLTRVLDADPGYGKLISKSPLSSKWTVYMTRKSLGPQRIIVNRRTQAYSRRERKDEKVFPQSESPAGG